jgi:hypothetical protein
MELRKSLLIVVILCYLSVKGVILQFVVDGVATEDGVVGPLAQSPEEAVLFLLLWFATYAVIILILHLVVVGILVLLLVLFLLSLLLQR